METARPPSAFSLGHSTQTSQKSQTSHSHTLLATSVYLWGHHGEILFATMLLNLGGGNSGFALHLKNTNELYKHVLWIS